MTSVIPLRYLSLCSGIEAASCAWEPLGWIPVAFAEHDPDSKDGGFAAALLAHYWPHVPNLGDISLITDERVAQLGPIDVVVGGTPCQDLSVAGLRAGLDGERSTLFFDFVRIFDAARRFCGARFCLWENVPGALASNNGRDFARVVGTLAGSEIAAPADGWGSEGVALGERGLVEWSVLDAQWFDLAQRRARVFALLDSGDWSGRPPVLLEPESLRGDFAPRRDAREDSPAGALRCTDGGSDVDRAQANQLIPTITGPLLSRTHRTGTRVGADEAAMAQLIPEVADPIVAVEGKTYTHEGENNFRLRNVVGAIAPDVATTITSREMKGPSSDATETLIVAAPLTHGAHPGSNIPGRRKEDDVNLVACFDTTQVTHPENRSTCSPETAALAATAHPPAIASRVAVRRLTPRECERLQGARDDYTLIHYRGKPASDSARYAALGNSMAIAVMAWIGRKLQEVLG